VVLDLQAPIGQRVRYGPIFAGLLSVAALAPLGACCRPTETLSSGHPHAILLVDQDTVDLGSSAPGSDSERFVVLANPGDHPIEVARVDSTCPCLEVLPSRFLVAPRQRRTLLLRHRPGSDDFRGRLAVELKGLTPAGLRVFRLRALAEVADPAPPGTVGSPSHSPHPGGTP
jgi:hypothetical protein